jgi:hypothetical protein
MERVMQEEAQLSQYTCGCVLSSIQTRHRIECVDAPNSYVAYWYHPGYSQNSAEKTQIKETQCRAETGAQSHC